MFLFTFTFFVVYDTFACYKKREKLLKLEILERPVLGVWMGKYGLLESMISQSNSRI